MTGLDSCVLTSACWLEEYLDTAGVADVDWSGRIPDEVITVVCAMHARGDTDEEIAARLAEAREIHVDTQLRNRGMPPDGWDDEFGPAPEVPYPPPPYPVHRMGGRWEPTPDAVAQVLDAPGRRVRRVITRPLAARRIPEDQGSLFDLLPQQRTAS